VSFSPFSIFAAAIYHRYFKKTKNNMSGKMLLKERFSAETKYQHSINKTTKI